MFFIRKAGPNDFTDIASIHVESWRAAYLGLLPESYIDNKISLFEKTKMWQALMAHPDVIVWLAYDASHNNLGFIGYFANNDHYEITTLYVSPEYHGLGIGTKLMTTSLQDIITPNINTHFHLWVLEANVAAINFYKKFGFIYSGENSEENYEGTTIVDIKMVRKTDNLTAYTILS